MIDLAIIGAGPAGLSAGLYGSRMGLETTIYEKLNTGGQITLSSEMENYPGVCEKMDGFTFMSCWPEQVKKFGAKIEMKEVERVSQNSDKTFTIHFKNGETERAISVIIATGSHPKRAGFENEEKFVGKGISTCAVCDGFFYKGKNVAVIGGGDTAVEESIYLSKIVNKVYLIHRRDSFRASPSTQKRLREIDNVEFILNTTVKKGYGEQFLEGLILNTPDGEKDLKIDGAFIFVGNERNNSVLKNSSGEFICEMSERGEMIVDIQMHSSVDGLYGAGDIRLLAPKQVISSAGDGAVAALEAVKYVDKFKNGEKK